MMMILIWAAFLPPLAMYIMIDIVSTLWIGLVGCMISPDHKAIHARYLPHKIMIMYTCVCFCTKCASVWVLRQVFVHTQAYFYRSLVRLCRIKYLHLYGIWVSLFFILFRYRSTWSLIQLEKLNLRDEAVCSSAKW